MSRDKKVEALWGLLMDDLTSRLKDGEEVVTIVKTDEGEQVQTTKVRPKATTLAVITKFLKDNEVQVPAGNDKTDRLADLLAKATKELAEETGLPH